MNRASSKTASRPRRPIATVPDVVWSPLVTTGLLVVVGLLGLAFHEPWLFPSLGPTVFLQVQSPRLPSARFYNTVVGHLIGVGAGFLSVWLVGVGDAPGVISSHDLTAVRLGAAALAMALTMLGMLLLRAPHPPGAATTLLFAEGSYRTGYDALTVLAGVLIIATIGEGIRQLRIGYLPPPDPKDTPLT